jgi:hypothetical protein
MTPIKLVCRIALGAALCLLPSVVFAQGQTARPEVRFRSGQPVYIVAYRDSQQFVADPTTGTSGFRTVKETYLDLEQKVDEQVRKWGYFHIVDRLSEAELILLVYTDTSSMEGMLVSRETYNEHYRDKFDLDQLRDKAFARATAGPLNIATLSRLSKRMIEQLRLKVEAPAR